MPRYEYPAGRHPVCRPIRHPGARPEPHERRVQARISPRCNGPDGRTESIRPLRAPGLIPAHVSSARESRSPIVRRPTRPSVSTRLAGSPAPHIFRSGTCTSTPVPDIPALLEFSPAPGQRCARGRYPTQSPASGWARRRAICCPAPRTHRIASGRIPARAERQNLAVLTVQRRARWLRDHVADSAGTATRAKTRTRFQRRS